jgi:hypothetical protein
MNTLALTLSNSQCHYFPGVFDGKPCSHKGLKRSASSFISHVRVVFLSVCIAQVSPPVVKLLPRKFPRIQQLVRTLIASDAGPGTFKGLTVSITTRQFL